MELREQETTEAFQDLDLRQMEMEVQRKQLEQVTPFCRLSASFTLISVLSSPAPLTPMRERNSIESVFVSRFTLNLVGPSSALMGIGDTVLWNAAK